MKRERESVCVCVCVCEREIERERESEWEQRCVCVCVLNSEWSKCKNKNLSSLQYNFFFTIVPLQVPMNLNQCLERDSNHQSYAMNQGLFCCAMLKNLFCVLGVEYCAGLLFWSNT